MNRRSWLKRSVAALRWAGLVAVLGGAAAQAARAAEPLPEEISVAQAKAKMEAGAYMLDVREPAEWERGHIPGATLIPLGQLRQRLGELPRDREIVVVCRSGGRSAMGRDILKEAGFKNVTSMAEGMNAWIQAGYPTVQ
jgi:rhodanese-related sulfurtransferase